MTTQRKIMLNDEIDRFIFRWDEFIIDYWWRKRYNVAFGSSAHREMNFIDMLIEYREQLNMLKVEQNEEDMKFNYEDNKVVHMTDKEIDEDYENLDLSKY